MTQQTISSTKNTPKNTTLNARGERPYRVVLVHPSTGVNWSGGSEIVAIELTRRLSSYFEVELLSGAACGSFSYPIPCIPRSYAYHAVRHPLIAPLVRQFSTPEIVVEHLTSFFPCLLRLLKHPADLIFPHNDYGGLAMAACVRALRGTPILFTEHNSSNADGKCLQRNLRFRPDHLVVLDEATATFAHNLKPTQPISVIPNGVNLEQFTPEGTAINLGLSRPIALCVASLSRKNHKRVELAIQAVARLPDVSLFVCGDGPDRAYFQALGDELLGPQRFAIRTFPHDQMPEVYRSADIFTLPSVDEPFGLVYLEAMASGLPVVATDDEMRRYLVGDSGILCDVTNLDVYTTAIKDALSGDWSVSARQNAARFSWDAIALSYRDVILETILHSKKELPLPTH
ncbi:MAG: glycosyltransferase family 4 protein [Scytonema sp. RU_4_4]|nr:glycosyltransferase family 4 protein [Scytonema sp. RU_4_4]NJR73894.1 glycosyltransferase family 4 protein [Scytonema sp. CRU_2_7]